MSKERKPSVIDMYHIIIRGNNREWIFKDPKDRDYYQKLLYESAKDTMELYAWCIMTNHVHMVVRIPFDTLPKLMMTMNSRYASYYKRKVPHVGHVFQNRFLSEPIDTEAYLLQVIRYVHNNPLKASITKEPETYPWSSYRWFFKGHSKRLSIDVLAGYFNNNSHRFVDYHQLADESEILDTPDEVKRFKRAHAQKIIETFCIEKGLREIGEINRKEYLMSELLHRLGRDSSITYREISELTNFPYAMIKEFCKKARNYKDA